MVFFGPFVLRKSGIWRMKPLSAWETVLASEEGGKLENAFCQAYPDTKPQGLGYLCAFAARFLYGAVKPSFSCGTAVADVLSLPQLIQLCQRYRDWYWKGGWDR